MATRVVVIALWVFVAGALGSLVRYVTDVVIRRLFGDALPLGTIAVNVVGSIIIGWITGVVIYNHPFSGLTTSELNTVVAIGFCGGLTTWSTASFETVRLFQQKRPATAVAFTFGSFVMALAGGVLGLMLAA